MIGNVTDLHGYYGIGLGIICGILVPTMALRPKRAESPYDLLTNARVQLQSGHTTRKLSLWARSYSRLNQRKIDAGLTALSARRLVFLFCVMACAGYAAGRVLLEAPIFGYFGSILGIYIFWLYLGWRAENLNRLKRAQIIEFITGMATAVASGASEKEAFTEQVAQLREEPLSFHLNRAQLEIDPKQGLGGRGFITVLASLNDALHDPLFHNFYSTISSSYSRSVSLAEPLQRNAEMARRIEALQSETQADFAQTRLAALVGYTLPFGLTFIIHALEPQLVESFYDSPLGLILGSFVALWCRFFYWFVLRNERVTLDEVRGSR